jgi:hypothetical protein
MVLNAFVLTSLFVGTLSLILMAAAALSALYFHRQYRKSEGMDERASAQSRVNLSMLLLFTAFLLRLANWPLFYILLQSFIPVVPGAMCIYGVTQVMPAFTALLQVLKPLSFFLMGGWLIFYGFDLSLRNHPFMNKSIRLLVAASTVAAIDGVAELIYILVFSPPGVAVSCCTVVADLVLPSSLLLPVPLFSAHYHRILMAGYHGFNLGLSGLICFLIWQRNSKHAWFAFIGIAALLNGAITYALFKEYLGPRLMHLPDHHCLYCLLQYQPIAIAILGFFILGSFLAIWPLWLGRVAVAGEVTERLATLNLHLFKWAAACLLASWVLTMLLQWAMP